MHLVFGSEHPPSVSQTPRARRHNTLWPLHPRSKSLEDWADEPVAFIDDTLRAVHTRVTKIAPRLSGAVVPGMQCNHVLIPVG